MIFIDVETYCELPIEVGTYKYARAAELMLVSYCIDDGPLIDIDLTSGRPSEREKLEELVTYIEGGEKLCAHNANFERLIFKYVLGIDTPLDQWEDTMVLGLTAGLPAKLEVLCQVLDMSEDESKIEDGAKLVQIFCKPNPKNYKKRRYTQEDKPKEWKRFIEYCRRDAELVRMLWNLIPKYNYNKMKRFWLLDQKINDRGFQVDVELCEKAIALTEDHQDRLNIELERVTGGEVTAHTQIANIVDYANENGVACTSIAKDVLENLLKRDKLPDSVRRMFEIRAEIGKSSTSKYAAALNAEIDGRLYGSLQFYGANRTGRWAGRQLQPQNMFRPSIKNIGAAISAIKNDSVGVYFG